MFLLKDPKTSLSRKNSAQGTSLYLGERLLTRFWLLKKSLAENFFGRG
jgi:hypothetical protein